MDAEALSRISHILTLLEMCARQYRHAMDAGMGRTTLALRVVADTLADELVRDIPANV